MTEESAEQLDLAVEDEPAGMPDERGLWFLTNRYNLLHVLSSRLIGPAESYPKYYEDLLQRVPGRVPVLTALPGPILQKAATEEGANNFPVLLQIDPSAAGVDPTDDIVVVPAVPLTAVARVLFPSDEALRDHHARPYDNVPDDDRLTVSTRHFAAVDEGADQKILAALGDLSAAESTAPWTLVESTRGAVGAVLMTLRLGLSARALERFVRSPLWEIVTSVTPSTSGDTDDFALTTAIVGALDASDRGRSWSARRFLGEVQQRLGESTTTEITSNLEALRSYASGDREFTSFKASSGALVAAKALLLLLLRPSLSRLGEWDRAGTNTSDDAYLLACAFAGRKDGITTTSLDQRNLDVDDLTATWAARAAASGEWAPVSITVESREDGDAVVLDGQTAFSGLPRVQTATDWWKDLSPADQTAAGPRIAQELGVPVVTVLDVPTAFVVRADGGHIQIEVPGVVQPEIRVNLGDIEAALAVVDDRAVTRLKELVDSSDSAPPPQVRRGKANDGARSRARRREQ